MRCDTCGIQLYFVCHTLQILNVHNAHVGQDEDFVDAVQYFQLSPDEPDTDLYELHAVGYSSNEPSKDSLIEEIERLTMENNAYKNQVSQLHFDIDRLHQVGHIPSVTRACDDGGLAYFLFD